MQSKLLTKSRFKLALECVTKLYYTGKKKEYADNNLNDPFLLALAKGGFQVGELAKYYFCDNPLKENITIDTLDYTESLNRTETMLNQTGRVVIAEAAFQFKNLFVRTDIIIKENNAISIYEVKAKSVDPISETFLSKTTGNISAEWQSYLYDLAFQKYVVSQALIAKGYKVSAYLTLVNKQSTATVADLNQKFKIHKEGAATKVRVRDGLTRKDLGDKILVDINMDLFCDKIIHDDDVPTDFKQGIKFEDFVNACAGIYENDKQEFTRLGSKCRSCQFKKDATDPPELKSGFESCWTAKNGVNAKNILEPLVTELWNGKAGKINFAEKLLAQDKYFLSQVEETDIAPKKIVKKDGDGLTSHARRMEQVNRVKKKKSESYFDKEGFQSKMQQWKYPLHLIDFETSMVPIPFHKDARPYEGIAFQFSHHTINSGWQIRHQSQYLSFEVGKFPNFEFVRELRKALCNDAGTIFRYHNHENTYLNFIERQLVASKNPLADKEQLISFIHEITHIKGSRTGARDMVDLYDLVLRYYYPPAAKGSNSLKSILPAMIAESNFLKDKYGKTGIYGKNQEVISLNFDDHVWIVPEKNNNPYKTLPQVFREYSPETLDLLVRDFEDIADGGAALTAYNYLQFSEIPEEQRGSIRDALLRYCELDTMAMVMIIEGWKNMNPDIAK